ncbi:MULTISPECIES: PTS fructose transporter subunit IIA [Buttiauxella]|uniref:PTS fructose transporter subunit IIA n=1 Tax=Buttiauxella TaxID=82976 RepID=UPI001561055F|nr:MULTISPECIES: PTS fructose transporter subunit IIA [Buttiauxella]MCS3603644.1 fructose-specific PTS system IIA-like component [Buttiauxella sp. BIGb0471]BCG07621.1 PTS fructose transporter subunit IIA [Buttiauxella agrestis]
MSFLNADAVNLNIGGNSAYSVLKNLAAMAADLGYINDKQAFMQTLLLREQNHSTGFGSGVAVPHGKSAAVVKPFVLFARSALDIDWKAMDGEGVNCWICIGIPEIGGEEQVNVISTLCRKIIHQDFIQQLKTGNAQDVVALLNQTLS